MIFNIVFGIWIFLAFTFFMLAVASNGHDIPADIFFICCMIGLTIMAVYSKEK